MKILLVSDTHGEHIELISAYAEEMKADICIHAGDFGFYDDASVNAMSYEELKLLIKHSSLPDEQKSILRQATSDERRKAIAKNHLLGCFPDFLNDKMRFGWPVYATWGNHDDANVVQKMIESPVRNLNMLHEKTFYDLGEFVILGVGGNCVPHKAFTQHYGRGHLPGAQCRPTSVLSQYLALLKTARSIPAGKHIVLVTHVSPIVEPFLELLAWVIGAEITVSGHMGRPDGETMTTDSARIPILRQTYEQMLELYPDAEKDLKLFYPEFDDRMIRHINLPDAADGYGVLEYADGRFVYEMCGVTYSTQKELKMGKDMFRFARATYSFATGEYSRMLPVADKIIAGELSNDDEAYYTERMLYCLGYGKMSELLHKCCESIIKRDPRFAVVLLDEEHEMMEGTEAPYSEELRHEYDLYKEKHTK